MNQKTTVKFIMTSLTLSLPVIVGVLGWFVIQLVDLSVGRGRPGTYETHLPAIPAVNVADLSLCKESHNNRWIGCQLAGTSMHETSTTQAAAPIAHEDLTGKQPQIQLAIQTDGDALLYKETVLHAKAQQIVKLTFKNLSSRRAGMPHNFVLVLPGKQDEVANQGIAAGAANDWVPQNSPNIITHTKLLKPGESESILFRAPANKGSYPYLCTFPGHSAAMKGNLVVD